MFQDPYARKASVLLNAFKLVLPSQSVQDGGNPEKPGWMGVWTALSGEKNICNSKRTYIEHFT